MSTNLPCQQVRGPDKAVLTRPRRAPRHIRTRPALISVLRNAIRDSAAEAASRAAIAALGTRATALATTYSQRGTAWAEHTETHLFTRLLKRFLGIAHACISVVGFPMYINRLFLRHCFTNLLPLCTRAEIPSVPARACIYSFFFCSHATSSTKLWHFVNFFLKHLRHPFVKSNRALRDEFSLFAHLAVCTR